MLGTIKSVTEFYVITHFVTIIIYNNDVVYRARFITIFYLRPQCTEIAYITRRDIKFAYYNNIILYYFFARGEKKTIARVSFAKYKNIK